MRIFLTGGTGFIGGHILRTLSAQGNVVTCLVRPRSPVGARLAVLPGVRIVEGEWIHPQTWLSYVEGHEVVINAVGIIRERRGASFAQVHTDAPSALFEAASHAGVEKIVQISALGADELARSRFHCTKLAADHYLTQLSVPYVILRPSFVYGPGDHSMAFFSRLARLPVAPVPGDGRYRVQPLHVCDLARAVWLAIQRPDLTAVIADLGGGEILTFDALLDLLARRQGSSKGARKLHIPWLLMELLASANALLGGHGPITRDELGMLRRENFTTHHPRFIELFGFEPVPFSQGLAWRELDDWHALSEVSSSYWEKESRQ